MQGKRGNLAGSSAIGWLVDVTRHETLGLAGECGVQVLVTPPPRFLGGLDDTLPYEREARATIALALEPLQTGDLPFHGAV